MKRVFGLQQPRDERAFCFFFFFLWLVSWHCSWTNQPPTNAATMLYSLKIIFLQYFQFSANKKYPNTPEVTSTKSMFRKDRKFSYRCCKI